ncbi:hypothetical protein [Paraglaciecola sp. T6c]|uniref:hypothetical protein n=1 Tax=Pseudoalteromonas atlantica (strain T6c / ATCC BAA-1087) TaxID=3042615 RepID=UPI0012EE8CA8|nr:hypothetical protein [Paraglaciecola sp. T6c]
MEELISQYPFLSTIFFICIACASMYLMSIFSGWRYLANTYGYTGKNRGIATRMRTVKMGTYFYSNCVTLGLDNEYVYFSLFFPFSIGHTPLKIPYKDIISATSTGSLDNLLSFEINDLNIKLPKMEVEKMIKASGGTWS